MWIFISYTWSIYIVNIKLVAILFKLCPHYTKMKVLFLFMFPTIFVVSELKRTIPIHDVAQRTRTMVKRNWWVNCATSCYDFANCYSSCWIWDNCEMCDKLRNGCRCIWLKLGGRLVEKYQKIHVTHEYMDVLQKKY